MSTQSFKAKGLHCRACEILIQDKIIEELGAQKVTSSYKTGDVVIDSKKQIGLEKLNQLFKDDGYTFHETNSNRPARFESTGQVANNSPKDSVIALGITLILGAVFLMLGKFGLASGFQVSASTALTGFFIFGLLAGGSTCAALVGGLILSMTKRWSEQNSSPLQVNLLFNIGRVLTYALFGYVLGSLGSVLQFSVSTTFLLTMIVVVVMVAMGLNMLGINVLTSLIPNVPALKSVPKNFARLGPLEPLALGAITLFLPCGFTFAAQTAAIASGNPIKGMLMLGMFALGTAPVLMMIGLTSRKALTNPKYAGIAAKTAGMLVILFAFQMINNQLNATGIGGIQSYLPVKADKTPIVTQPNGHQAIEIGIFANRFEPNSITLTAGVPVTLKITDKGMTGCTSAVKSPGLFDLIELTPKGTVEKTFTPQKPGKYILSCWMGMVTSQINVLSAK